MLVSPTFCPERGSTMKQYWYFSGGSNWLIDPMFCVNTCAAPKAFAIAMASTKAARGEQRPVWMHDSRMGLIEGRFVLS